jgi:hypothetical protein
MVDEIYAPIAQEGAAYLRRLDPATLLQLSEFLRFATRQQQQHAARLAGAG